MIENSLMQSNFIGRDGFRWWVGQVAPEDAQGSQTVSYTHLTLPTKA